jgi:hypothetical protein
MRKLSASLKVRLIGLAIYLFILIFFAARPLL